GDGAGERGTGHVDLPRARCTKGADISRPPEAQRGVSLRHASRACCRRGLGARAGVAKGTGRVAPGGTPRLSRFRGSAVMRIASVAALSAVARGPGFLVPIVL